MVVAWGSHTDHFEKRRRERKLRLEKQQAMLSAFVLPTMWALLTHSLPFSPSTPPSAPLSLSPFFTVRKELSEASRGVGVGVRVADSFYSVSWLTSIQWRHRRGGGPAPRSHTASPPAPTPTLPPTPPFPTSGWCHAPALPPSLRSTISMLAAAGSGPGPWLQAAPDPIRCSTETAVMEASLRRDSLPTSWLLTQLMRLSQLIASRWLFDSGLWGNGRSMSVGLDLSNHELE